MKTADTKTSSLRERAESISRDCIAVRVRLLNRIITGIYDKAMRPYGIKLNQASMLTVILLADNPGYGEICRRLHMEKSTLSRNIDRMRQHGWIETLGRGNGIGTILRVTPKGKRVLEKAYLAWEKAQKEAKRRLGPDGTGMLMKLAEKFWPTGVGQEE